jgi:hypothetical protein
LHTNVSNAGSLFQVASQFNLLEMVSPNYTPEEIHMVIRFAFKILTSDFQVKRWSAGNE